MINEVILGILKNRGIVEDKDIEEFLSLKPKRTYDPFLLLNMEEGVDLILDRCREGKRICLYGDYDSDGITSISILNYILSQLTDNLIYYIPDRFKDGYGISKGALDTLHEKGVDLIVSVDCGITAIEEVEYCKSLGIEIIITDHHTPQENLPDCLIINPKQEACPYPFKDLAGCGVAFKLAQGIRIKADLPKSVINHVLDIVAIGTVGDIVPLVDENRTIVKYGLQSIKNKKKTGLSALLSLLGEDEVTSQTISFGIVPHLNAAGRMKSALTGVGLFTSKRDGDALDFAKELITLNNLRKAEQNRLYERCKTKYHLEYEDKLFPLILMDQAHEGITGIVAGKIKDFTKKPIGILTEDHRGEYLKGTSRGLDQIDIFKILSKAKDKSLFEKFGGHKGACGFSIKRENYEKLVSLVEEEMSKLSEDDMKAKVHYDYILQGHDLNLKLVDDLKVLEPYGHMNPKPVFKIEKVKVLNVFFMGNNEEHIRLKLFKDGTTFEGLAFNYENIFTHNIENGNLIDIVGSLDINQWRNKKTLQIMLQFIDLK